MADYSRSTKKCYICGYNAVTWDIDVDAGDVGSDMNGILHKYHCMKCGAEISVYEEFSNERDKRDSQ